MNKTKIAKIVVKNVVGWSTSFTVANALRNNVNPSTPIEQIEVWVGSVAVGAVVAEATEAWSSKIIDDITAAWTSSKEKKA